MKYIFQNSLQIENNLSDQLHISLTNRFVDISASYFVNAELDGFEPTVEIDDNKLIILNGKKYGFINGFDVKLEKFTFSDSLFSLTHVKKYLRYMIDG